MNDHLLYTSSSTICALGLLNQPAQPKLWTI
jgi:hypothetical protein